MFNVDIVEILLKVALTTIAITLTPIGVYRHVQQFFSAILWLQN